MHDTKHAAKHKWDGVALKRTLDTIFTVLLQFDISYLVGAGGSRTAWEGADPGATTAAVPTVTGKGLAGWTAPP